ncbi:MAG: elongation factor P, partial [Acidimicrobiia bacterium]|nr:elongation factor P [Acidimicrobiia bacterium]
MPIITTNDLKNGMTLSLDDGLFQVVSNEHVKPGKGHAFVRTTLKNARTGAVLDRTFRAGEKVERVLIDKRDMQFLYRDGADYVFMDTSTYDQLHVPADQLGDAADYLIENHEAVLLMHESEILGTDLPAAVVLTIPAPEP